MSELPSETVGWMPPMPKSNMIGGRFLTSAELREDYGLDCGDNVMLHDTCQIVHTQNITIGHNVRIDPFCIISGAGGDVRIGSYVHIASGVYIFGAGGVEIGDFAGLSSGVKVYSASDDYSGKVLTNPTVPAEYLNVIKKRVVIERHCIVGAGAVILPGAHLGEGAAVGSLSLVAKPLAPWGIYVGARAERLKDRKRDLLEQEARLLGLAAAA